MRSSSLTSNITSTTSRMPLLQNKRFNAVLSLIRSNWLGLGLLSSTISTFSPSKSPKYMFFELPATKTTIQCTLLIKIFSQKHRFLQSLLLFKKLLLLPPSSSSKLDLYLFPSLLKSCVCLPYPNHGLGIHCFLIKSGFGNWVGSGNSLFLMYMKFGWTRDAYRVFEDMPIRDGDLYNSIVCSFGSNDLYEDVASVFEEMLELGFLPHLNSVIHAIRAFGELGSMESGMLIHDFVIQNGFDFHVPIANSLISMYINIGRLDYGRRVFDGMHDRDLVSWNSLITGYARSGNWLETLDIFLSMKKDGNSVPNRVTFLGLLSACGQSGNLSLGEGIHGLLICMGLLSDFRLGTAIVDMYTKCDRVVCARRVFEDLSEKSLVTWNSLIGGYSQNGYHSEAVILFNQMTVTSNLKPDPITFANVIPAYASLANIGSIQSIHTLIVKKGLDMDGDVVLGTAMVDAYGKCSNIKAARSLFTCIKKPNTATWNAMIAGYSLNHLADEGMRLFCEMLRMKVFLDPITMVMLFQLCGELGSLKQGSMVHGYCLSKGFSSHLTVANAMIDMYMKCGCVYSSELLFNTMSLKNIVTWNTMLFGYVKVGFSTMAMRLFCQMQSENQHRPDLVTMISFVQASAALLAGQGVEMAQSFIVKLGLESETLVVNSLVDAYAKNGLIQNARDLFTQMGELRDQSSWNVMIAGCGMNGRGIEACELFSLMEEEGFKPNSITFISLLSSCSHSGLIEEGCRYLNMMVAKYKIMPGLEHLTCIVDMFARTGRLEEAYQLIKAELYQTSDGSPLSGCDAVWGALLSACRMNMNMELGELAGERLSELAPDNCGYHTLLSNLYASNNKWDEAAETRKVFEDGRLLKKPGLSLVEL